MERVTPKMKKINNKSLTFKIITTSAICIGVMSILSNLYIYGYMNNIIQKSSDEMSWNYVDYIQEQMDYKLSQINNLVYACIGDNDIINTFTGIPSNKQMVELYYAQQTLSKVMSVSPTDITLYIDKFVVLNDKGLILQATTKVSGEISDYQNIMNSKLMGELRGQTSNLLLVQPSISDPNKDVLVGLYPVNDPHSNTETYIYIELSLKLVQDIISSYAIGDPIFVIDKEGYRIGSKGIMNIHEIDINQEETNMFFNNHNKYKIYHKKLDNAQLEIYNCMDLSKISVSNLDLLYSSIIMLITVIIVSVCLVAITTHYITRPIHTLILHIKRINQNDFSFNPEIEKSSGEIGDIGKAINEMILSIDILLQENKKNNEQQRNIEIALLQSQVNPHFLYNTLDSIHWMAVIQKNNGIIKMTRSLSNLLKNIAKGTQDEIPIQEELALLDDYIAIQAIRYMDTFEIINNIPKEIYNYHIIKFTLQPLIENAIFHGIEPKGTCGTITLDGREEAETIVITVTDTGVGISSEKIDQLLKSTPKSTDKSSLNGIGVYNVHQRLKLNYGKQYGLHFDSIVGEYTTVQVTIPKKTDGQKSTEERMYV